MASQIHAPTLAAGVGIGVFAAMSANWFFKKVEDEKKKKEACKTPATTWPSGKPTFTEMGAYPAWDDADKTGWAPRSVFS
jgi:hypothetical protein